MNKKVMIQFDYQMTSFHLLKGEIFQKREKRHFSFTNPLQNLQQQDQQQRIQKCF